MSHYSNSTTFTTMGNTERCEISAPATLLALIRSALKLENSKDSVALFFKKAALARVQQVYHQHGKQPPDVQFRTRGEKIKK